MGTRRRQLLAAAIVLAAGALAVAAGVARSGSDEGARCGPGFVAKKARCIVIVPAQANERVSCPSPLVSTAQGCDAPDLRVLVPAASLTVGPSDWEAEGRIASRTFSVTPFRIDAFEVTVGRYSAWEGHEPPPADLARAACGMTRARAQAFCRSRRGDLPTEEQWMAAAVSASSPVRRYPWGDTGAVCRRAAWGLAEGPCARGADGPDTVGAHTDGDSPLGLHDLAGNVAEWVLGPSPGGAVPPAQPEAAFAKGGSWASAMASELRVWARLELPAGWAGAAVGFRCVYDATP